MNTSDRMRRCPAYCKDKTCIDFNLRLGWRTLLNDSTCDTCHSLGGLSGAEEYRVQKCGTIIETMLKTENLSRAGREILVPLTLKHRRLPLDVLHMGPIKEKLDSEAGALESRESFKEAGKFQRGTLKDYLKSKWSLLVESPLDPSLRAQRQESCETCPSYTLAENGINHFCNDCGCGEREDAFLDSTINGFTKLDYPYLKCPRRRKGFSNAILTVNGNPH